MPKNLKKRAKILLILGLVALIAGIWLYSTNDSAAINETNINIARTATNANDAARQIAANNQADMGAHTLSMFLMGLGGILTFFCIIMLVRKTTEKTQRF